MLCAVIRKVQIWVPFLLGSWFLVERINDKSYRGCTTLVPYWWERNQEGISWIPCIGGINKSIIYKEEEIQ